MEGALSGINNGAKKARLVFESGDEINERVRGRDFSRKLSG